MATSAGGGHGLRFRTRTFVPESWTDPAGFLEANLLGAVWGGDYCRERKASMVYLSSYLYGNAGSMPIPESAPLDTPNPYALSNKLAEDVCSFYASQYGVPSTILRPFNVYGPGQSDRFLIPSLVRQARSGGIVEIKDASPRRDYVYVEDVVNAIVKAAERKDGYGVFNIGTGHSHSVAEVIDMLCDLVGRDIEVRDAGERRPAEIMDSRADVARAREVLGWTPHWTLRDGLARMLEA